MTTRTRRTTKKANVKGTATAIAIVILMLGIYIFASYIDTHYTREAVTTYTDNTGRVVAMDNSGNIWEFKADNLDAGQTIKMKMYTNNTNTIYDDEVVGVKIVAEVE